MNSKKENRNVKKNEVKDYLKDWIVILKEDEKKKKRKSSVLPDNEKPVNEETSTRMLERERALDFFSLQGLSTQTSCAHQDLDIFMLKELIDNSLDACKGTNPTVEASFKINKCTTLTVKDDGKGLTEADVKRITDFGRSYSSKFHYKYPTRGALGNALKCVFGIPYALASELQQELPVVPIRIRSKGKEYSVCFDVQELKEQVDCQISPKDIELKKGTEISIAFFPLGDSWGKECLGLMRGYAIFNPDANIKFEIKSPKHKKHVTVVYQTTARKTKKFTGGSSIHWYSPSQFKQLVEAFVRSIRKGESDLTLREFIRQFRGLSSDEKVAKIITEIQEGGDIRHLSDLADKVKLIFGLYESMKRNCNEPSPSILGKIGKKQMRDRLEQIYGTIPDANFKYKRVEGVHREKSFSVPYVLETAIAILDKEDLSLTIHAGMNHSPCLYNPFEGYSSGWEDEKGNKKEASIMTGLLERYKIDSKQPVVMVVHLICPNIEYQSYGKGEININPFFKAIAQALTKVCRFYPRHKRRKFSVSGKTSLARIYLVEELERRKSLVEQYGVVPQEERTTQQGVYYKVRSQMGGEIDMKRGSFASALREECIRMGGDLSFREKLGITAAERAQFFFRGNTYPVKWESLEELATIGCDVILIEKEGVCQVLEPYAGKRGIALLNSRGFATHYAQQLLKLSKTLKGNLFILTDFDASGLLIGEKTLKGVIPRLGVDLEMVSKLNLSRGDLEEIYDTKDGKAPKNHLKDLPPQIQKEVRDKRIEIDAVLVAVGPEKLWNYLEEGMLNIAPQRDLTRSAQLTIPLPLEISRSMIKIREFIQTVVGPTQKDIKARMANWRQGFADIEKIEKSFQTRMLRVMRSDERIQELAQQIKKLADSISKNSQKVDSK